MQLNVYDILSKVYGPRGLPFPRPAQTTPGHGVASPFNGVGAPALQTANNKYGTPVKLVTDAQLGRYEFIPVVIENYPLPNAIIIISGEKKIIETDVVDIGTVYEKAFTAPYDISIIITIIGDDGNWPESDVSDIVGLWGFDKPLTLRSALTDYYLQPKDNFIITKISHLDAGGMENVEVIQLDGRSNIDLNLEIQ